MNLSSATQERPASSDSCNRPGICVTGQLRITRSKGLLAGLLLVPLGIWDAFVPFVGPYFGYGIGHTGTWYFSYGRLWLDVLPGVAVLLGGLALAVLGARDVRVAR